MSKVVTSEITFMTRGEVDIHDLTMEVDAKIGGSGIQNGIVTIFVPGSTAAITTIEYEPGLLQDIPDALERLFPKNIKYGHEMRWHDGNGHSHVRAAFLGPSLTVPITGGRMSLGTWQQVVFIELDNKARDRRVILQIMGE
ncbi:MAG: secondary thiamine-phosphate synthase enzyme YjbQ [Candidatus Syntrophoarchaeum sp.]|nr:secondary thiamine-phosphate synthase enzyme YjbQ [Candidatus Syntrophoarchaeum sp.]